jgi:hypothetical protein
MKKPFTIVFTAAIFLAGLSMGKIYFAPTSVQADGAILPPDDYYYPVYGTSQKALIIFEDDHEDLLISVSFSGQASEFGWIIPLPSQPEILKVDSSIFSTLEDLTEPKQNLLEKLRGEDYYYSISGMAELAAPGLKSDEAESSVEVIEEKSIGIFDYAILTAEDPDDLKEWMDENDYNLPGEEEDDDDDYFYIWGSTKSQAELWSDALPIIQDYIDSDWYFVTVKVNNKFVDSSGVETQLEEGAVDPLRFSFDTTDMIYPMKLTAIGKKNVSVLLYVIDDHKVRVKNYNYDYCSSDSEECSYFDTSYASKIKKDEILDLTNEVGKGSWYEPDSDMYITKLNASSISYEEMDEEILFADSSSKQGVNDGSMSFWEWVQLPFVFVVYLPYLVLGGFFELIDVEGYYWDYGLGFAWFVCIGAALFVGSLIWIVVSILLLKKTKKRFKRFILYILQFPSVWFVASIVSLLLMIPVAIVVGILAQNEIVTVIDSICCFTLFAAFLPVVFYRLLWRRKDKQRNSRTAKQKKRRKR